MAVMKYSYNYILLPSDSISASSALLLDMMTLPQNISQHQHQQHLCWTLQFSWTCWNNVKSLQKHKFLRRPSGWCTVMFQFIWTLECVVSCPPEYCMLLSSVCWLSAGFYLWGLSLPWQHDCLLWAPFVTDAVPQCTPCPLSLSSHKVTLFWVFVVLLSIRPCD